MFNRSVLFLFAVLLKACSAFERVDITVHINIFRLIMDTIVDISGGLFEIGAAAEMLGGDFV